MGFYVWQVRRGDTGSLQVVHNDSNNNPIDITGFTFELEIDIGDTTYTYTTSPEVVCSSPATGAVLLTLSTAETDAYLTNHGWYHFKITSPGGVGTTLIHGDLYVDG